MNVSKVAAMALSSVGSQTGVKNVTKPYDKKYKQSKAAGMRSKQYQFPDKEKLADGRHRFYLKNGFLIQRGV